MSKESIDETIERFRRDRQMIKDRMDERNKLYEKASQNYLTSLQREVETIKRTRPLAETRNQDFREQISNLFKRYEEGSGRLKQAIHKTNIEKINYNNYLIKVYPNYFTDEKKKLQEENQRLMQQLQGFKQLPSHKPLQEVPIIDNREIDDQEQYDKYLGPQYEQDQYQQPSYQQHSQQQHSYQQHVPINQNQSNNSKLNITKQQEQDLLSEYLIPQQGKK